MTPAPIQMRFKDSQPDSRWAPHGLIAGHYLPRAVCLWLVEMLVPPQPDDPRIEIISGSVHVLVNTGGQKRSEVEFQRRLEAARIELARIASAETLGSVVKAMRGPNAGPFAI